MAFQILGCCLSNRNLKYSALEWTVTWGMTKNLSLSVF
jgi:hypothetical protein